MLASTLGSGVHESLFARVFVVILLRQPLYEPATIVPSCLVGRLPVYASQHAVEYLSEYMPGYSVEYVAERLAECLAEYLPQPKPLQQKCTFVSTARYSSKEEERHERKMEDR